MTSYKLMNNLYNYSEAFADFRTLRGNFTERISVQFPAKDTALTSLLKDDTKPVPVRYEAASGYAKRKKVPTPDISVWLHGCLILNLPAYEALKKELNSFGEFIPLSEGKVLFNITNRLPSDSVDANHSHVEVSGVVNEQGEEVSIIGATTKLQFIEDKIADQLIFKPSFGNNTSLFCSDKLKSLVEKYELNGLIFEQDLVAMFPKEPS